MCEYTTIKMMKKCSKCGIKRKLSYFCKDVSKYDGLHSHCSICRKIRQKQYYKENKIIIKKKTRKYIDKHRKKYNEYSRNSKSSLCKCGKRKLKVSQYCKRCYRGKNVYNWKDNPHYITLHNWIRRNKIKPKVCEYCKKSSPYDCANISGKYKRDINDYEWLCRKCHMKKDGRMKNLRNQ